LKTLNITVASTKGVYSETVFSTVCGDALINCINSFKNLCAKTNAMFDEIREPDKSLVYWTWVYEERKDLIP